MSASALYPVPASWHQSAWINKQKYTEMYRQSIEQPEQFWAEHIPTLHWEAPRLTSLLGPSSSRRFSATSSQFSISASRAKPGRLHLENFFRSSGHSGLHSQWCGFHPSRKVVLRTILINKMIDSPCGRCQSKGHAASKCGLYTSP